MKVYAISIDVAKVNFQVCVIGCDKKILANRSVKRDRLLDFVRQYSCEFIAMEACSSSNFWGRTLIREGYKVVLVPAQHVKPFLSKNKSDRNDAVAIFEASERPNLHFVTPKSLAQQDAKLLISTRQHFMKIALDSANMIRSFLGEYGVLIFENSKLVETTLAAMEEDNELTSIARTYVQELLNLYQKTMLKIKELDHAVKALSQQHEKSKKLQTIPGIGPMISLYIFAQMSDPKGYKNGRQYSASLGLVPKHWGTGGRVKMLGISRRGDPELRSLLIHGARSVAIQVQRSKSTAQYSEWAKKKIDERGFNKAVVAIANKNARIAWAYMAS